MSATPPIKHPIADLVAFVKQGQRKGVTAVCASHPFVIEATLALAKELQSNVLIEATCNQVNHHGGYTSMTPAAFRDFVFKIADNVGQPREKITLGGDHLGPNPWKSLQVEDAMQESERMVEAYVEAGFTKIHLDTSMACGDDFSPLSDQTIAQRAARLAVVAERVSSAIGTNVCYVIGTEVPAPGGAHENITSLEATRPEAAVETVALHERAFNDAGIPEAFKRIAGLVVQPGVEFGSQNVITYAPEKAAGLSAVLEQLPGLVFEAHSTDYQPLTRLSDLVRDGFAILKVGPGLTFAMREALYGLDAIASHVAPGSPSLAVEMERIMCDRPDEWDRYYSGTERERYVMRHFSYSDRIRYYWPLPEAQRAVDQLLSRIGKTPIPETLISQYLPRLYEGVVSGEISPHPENLIRASIMQVLRFYSEACNVCHVPSQRG
ncbi:MAG: D-tagatose-bisphosphate aldolase, class II, non-catalytic subunit [Hoeflea sp.]|uniref:D-tagatose-bisphosphate aldolase, class II, non-catalytic subunit n=1 Tax=Hoeflea sp. TaxID=1940281 RepID=UPI00329864C8